MKLVSLNMFKEYDNRCLNLLSDSFDNSNILFLVFDSSFKVICVNEELSKFIAINKSEIYGKNWFENFVQKDFIEDNKSTCINLLNEHKQNKSGFISFKNLLIRKSTDNTEITWKIKLIEELSKDKIFICLGLKSDLTLPLREELSHNYDLLQLIKCVFQAFFDNENLDEILKQILTILFSISWMSFDGKGRVFLVDKDNKDLLLLKVQVGFDESLVKSCEKVEFGKCYCGEAAQTKEIVYSTGIITSEKIICETVNKRGHYCAPIVFQNKLYGVLNIFLKQDIGRNKNTEDFLKEITNVLAIMIEKKDYENSLLEYRKKLETKIGELERFHKLTVDRELEMIKLKRKIKEFEPK